MLVILLGLAEYTGVCSAHADMCACDNLCDQIDLQLTTFNL